ncbi:hypothetical protein RAA17_21215 [Komagataeibacter rhaeticus]|nr:hypothetical protein [Komagataeibacter rhaeticus]
MRIWASACLLLCLPAGASAAGLFGVTHPTLACGDDVILRSLSDHTITAQQSPAWRRTLFRQGTAIWSRPMSGGERSPTATGCRSCAACPHAGAAAALFHDRDITPCPPLAGPAATPAERHAPAPLTPPHPTPEPTAPDAPLAHPVAPVIVQHTETPLPTDIFFMTRGFQKLGSLILTLMLAGGAAWVMVLILRAGWRMTRRRGAIRQCMELAERHRPMLVRWYRQAQAGNGPSHTPWETHVERFTHATLIPALARSGRGASWPGIRRAVLAHITTMAAGTSPAPRTVPSPPVSIIRT